MFFSILYLVITLKSTGYFLPYSSLSTNYTDFQPETTTLNIIFTPKGDDRQKNMDKLIKKQI